VDVQRIIKGHKDVADTLLSHAADAGTDFIVMGGHGHSRVREFFLGNVTDTVLRSVKVPVLLAH
jgi:nucleotide-binding universal stress UspA family protein